MSRIQGGDLTFSGVDGVGSLGRNSVGDVVGRNGETINNISNNIHMGQQGKHIIGHNNFLPNRSVLTSNPQELLRSYHSGNISSSQVINSAKIRVDFGTEIGNFFDRGTKTFIPTTNGIIHNSKLGAHMRFSLRMGEEFTFQTAYLVIPFYYLLLGNFTLSNPKDLAR